MKPFVEVKVPVENVNDVTARLLAWRFESGANVTEGDILAEMETTKAVFEVPAPATGIVQFAWSPSTEVPVGDVLCRIYTEGLPDVLEAAPATSAPAAATQIVFSKKARELLAQSGLTESDFAGAAFVTEADIRDKMSGRATPPAAPPRAPTADQQAPPAEEGDLIPLERAKLYENRELLAAARSVLRSTLFHLCPAPGLQEACARQHPPADRLAIILFEIVRLLVRFRSLNACFHADAMHQYRQVNLGFAADMGHGLKVLVIRRAEELSFTELAARIEDVLVKYSTNTLAVADVTGSTFTVTDLSGEGVFTFDPVINSHQAAILGIGTDQPGGFLLSCAFDHRINGGRVVAEFLRELSARLVGQAKSLQGASEKSCAHCLLPASTLRSRGHMLIASAEPEGYVCSICLTGY